MSELFQIIIFYLALTVLGLFAFRLFKNIFSNFADRGYAFSKIIGALILAYISWLLKYLFHGEVISSIILVAFVVVATALFVRSIKPKLIINKHIVLTELLFLTSFIAMLLFRSAIPKIEGIEKFMDYAIINSLLRESTIPPMDVWYSGETINYYYFGHYIIATLFKLTDVRPNVGYNLAVALVFAAVITQTYAMAYFLTKKHVFGVFGAALLAIGSNLDLLHHYLFVNSHDYFYAEARSLIPNTINEFPAYSFLISDLHAHIIDIPFVLLFIALILAVVFKKDLIKTKLYFFILALAFGALAAINSWDMFIYAPVLVGALSYVFYTTKFKISTSVLYIGALVLTSICMFLPMYLHFKPAVGGIGFFPFTLDSSAILRMFGFFLLIITVFYLTTLKTLRTLDFTSKFVLCVFAYGLALILLPEFVFVKDIYFKLNPPYFRANTIFKIWYQTWILFSVFAPFALYRSLELIKNFKVRVTYKVAIMILCLFVFGSTASSIIYIVGPKYVNKGLDGTAYLLTDFSDAKKLIDWINLNIKGSAVLLEAPGESYTMDSLISSYTGLPTLVGWSSHELGWRDNWPEIANRMGDIEMMYKNNEKTPELLKKYNVKYVVIGQNELTKYGKNAGTKLSENAKQLIKFGNYTLLEITQ